jgi:hypothetical protein
MSGQYLKLGQDCLHTLSDSSFINHATIQLYCSDSESFFDKSQIKYTKLKYNFKYFIK